MNEQREMRRNVVTYGNLAVEPVRQKRTVRRKRKVRVDLPFSEKMLYITGLLLCLGLASLLLSQYAQLAQLNYKVQELKVEIRQTEAENQNLALKLATKATPEKILETAKDMGMRKDAGKVVILPTDSPRQAPVSDIASRGEEAHEVQTEDRDS